MVEFITAQRILVHALQARVTPQSTEFIQYTGTVRSVVGMRGTIVKFLNEISSLCSGDASGAATALANAVGDGLVFLLLLLLLLSLSLLVLCQR